MTVFPPKGKDNISAQGHSISITGKKLQITKELIVLHKAGFIRIAEDIVNPRSEELSTKSPSDPSGAITSEAEGGSVTTSPPDPPEPLPQIVDVPEGASDAHSDVVSSLTLEGEGSQAPKPSTFTTRKEIEETLDWEALRDYIASKIGYFYQKKSLEALRSMALEQFDAK